MSLADDRADLSKIICMYNFFNEFQLRVKL